MSTRNKILDYLRRSGTVSGSQLEHQAFDWNTKASVISRRCRELAHEGLIVRTLSERKTVQYGITQRPQFDPVKYLEQLRAEEQREQVKLI